MIKYFKYDPIPTNQSSRYNNKIEWIVIHDTANENPGADAIAHKKFFSNYRGASAHYFVDDTRVIQIVADSKAAWHCGENQGYGRALNGCTNSNSIGVELCINSDGNYEEAYENLIELVKNLMYYHKIPAERVCRHYDVSRKKCPGTFFKKNLWEKFKKDIQEEREYNIDIRQNYFEPERINKAPKMRDETVASWATNAWEWAKKKNITDGSRPKAPATREEVITFIERLYEVLKNEAK